MSDQILDPKKVIKALMDGSRLKFEWKNDQKGSLIEKQLPNLSTFKGKFVDGELHGHGEKVYKNGDHYTG